MPRLFPGFASKVSRRAFLLFAACALLPVSILAVLSLRQVTAELQGQSERRLRQSTKAMGLLLHKRLLALEAALNEDPRPGAPERSEPLERPFLGLAAMSPGQPARTLWGQVGDLPELRPEEVRFLEAGGVLFATEPTPGGTARYFVTRLLNPHHPEQGWIRGEVNPAYIWEVQDEAMLEYGTQLLVLDETGRPLISSLEAGVIPAALHAGVRKGPSGQFTWQGEGGEYLSSYWTLFLKNRFYTGNWTIVLSRPTREIFAPLDDFRRTFVLVTVLSFLVVLLLSLGQIRRILHPLEQLKTATERLAEGRLDARVDVQSRDEFEDLGKSFNQMASQLERQFDALILRNDLTLALSRNEALDSALQSWAEIVAEHLDLPIAGVWLVEPDGKSLNAAALAGAAHAGASMLARLGVGVGQIGRVASEARPLVVTGAPTELWWADPSWATREGLVAFVGHPLMVDGRVQGVAAAFARRALDGLDLASFASASTEVAQALERRRVARALQSSEEQVRQLQKMEAVGRLAGGVAHDFNNLLTVIMGYSQLLLADLPEGDDRRESAEVIQNTANRAAQLTRQLLAFSRKQVLAPKVLDLNSLLEGMTPILHRLIGESIELSFVRSPQATLIKADRSQIEQVIVNVVVNARDAMPQGGFLALQTGWIDLNADQASHLPGLRAGRHVTLKVTDTGVGMDAATQARIFEPFFTTKEPGKGTGLGLATVYGIVAQSGGSIQVESTLGRGSSFTFFFPAAAGEVETSLPAVAPAARGSETILLVEDEQDVRRLLEKVLRDLGYHVLTAARPSPALRLAEEHPGEIHLLLTDMVMPEMSGAMLAQKISANRPEMAVLLMSGYTEYRGEVADVSSARAFLQKPFTPDALARAIRSALGVRAP